MVLHSFYTNQRGLRDPVGAAAAANGTVRWRRATSRFDTPRSRLPALLHEPARLADPCRSGGSREWGGGAATSDIAVRHAAFAPAGAPT